MVTEIKWVTLGDSMIGLFPCAVGEIFITNDGTRNKPSYRVRFGTAESDARFKNLKDAKIAGVDLAKRILWNCLAVLECTKV